MSKDIYLAKNPLHKLFVGFDTVTKTKYLFVTIKEGRQLEQYKGSSRLWRILTKGRTADIKKIKIFESRDPYIFMRQCVRVSYELNVVKRSDWINKIIEHGNTGLGLGNLSTLARTQDKDRKCDWCGVECRAATFSRYHGKRCKKNPNSIGHIKDRADIECEHCGKDGLTGSNYTRWHGDNCLENPNFDPQNNTRPVKKKYKLSDEKKKTCPHCSIRVGHSSFLKYHGDNCKQNPEYDPSKDRYRFGDVECEHCGKRGTQSNYTKFHGDNCPENPEYDASKDQERKNSMKGLSKTPSWRGVRLPKEASAA